MNQPLPDKLFFRIGEVSRIAEVEPHVLRYWESEFNALHPIKNKTGQRVYKKRDVERVLEIKRLLYHERYSIEGAKKKITRRKKFNDKVESLANGLGSIKKELHAILDMLKK